MVVIEKDQIEKLSIDKAHCRREGPQNYTRPLRLIYIYESRRLKV